LKVGFGVGFTTGLLVGLGVAVGLGVTTGVVVAVGLGVTTGAVVPVGFGVTTGLVVPVGLGVTMGFCVTMGFGVTTGLGVGREMTGSPPGVPVAPGPGGGMTSGTVDGDGDGRPLGEAIADDGTGAEADAPGATDPEPLGARVGPTAVDVWLGVGAVAAGEPAAVPGVAAPTDRSGEVRSATLTASATETRSTLMMPSAMTARRRWAAVTSIEAPRGQRRAG
jgi:hypothetical protein